MAKNIKNIEVTQVDSDNNKTTETFTIGSPIYTEITYKELYDLKVTGKLQEGGFYRITDYETRIKSNHSFAKSAGRMFDIVVQAISNDKLSENAKAVSLSNNRSIDFFQNCKMNAWEIKYSIDNDERRFDWIENDPNKYRGVIYYMKDEFNNVAPYDFKNITFDNGSESYFTFCVKSPENGIEDQSIVGEATNNYIEPHYDENGVQVLNNIVFFSSSSNTSSGPSRKNLSNNNNYFGPNCHDIRLGGGCDNNKFDGGNSYICLGTSTNYNSLAGVMTGKNFCINNHFADGVACICVNPTGTLSISSKMMNVNVHRGTHGGTLTSTSVPNSYTVNSSNPVILVDVADKNNGYEINLALDKKGVLTQWTT